MVICEAWWFYVCLLENSYAVRKKKKLALLWESWGLTWCHGTTNVRIWSGALPTCRLKYIRCHPTKRTDIKIYPNAFIHQWHDPHAECTVSASHCYKVLDAGFFKSMSTDIHFHSPCISSDGCGLSKVPACLSANTHRGEDHLTPSEAMHDKLKV